MEVEHGVDVPGLTDIPDSCLYDDVTGVILAGGRGRRMGMVDKGLQLLKGKPMVEHVINRLRPQVSTLMINANRNTEAYATFGYPVYADDPMDFSGPLAGFLTGLRHCKTLYLVTAPCDAPFLSRHLVEDLIVRWMENGLIWPWPFHGPMNIARSSPFFA